MKHIKIDKVLVIAREDAGINNLLARVSPKHINDFVKRREAIIIENPENKTKIIRYALGGGGITGLNRSAICIDYDGIDSLGLKYAKEIPCNLILRKPKLFEEYFLYWKHPDLSVRLSLRLSVLGVFLGFLGLLTGVMS